MFKVNYMNGDNLDTLLSASTILGRGGHKAVEGYLRALGSDISGNDGEAIKAGLLAGTEHLKTVSDGMVGWNKTIENRSKLDERFAKSYFGYVKALDVQRRAKRILMIEQTLEHKVKVNGAELPIPLKGIPDWVFEDQEGRIIIEDHKFTSRFSNTEAIDGAKLLQASILFFLVHAELGRAPYAICFREWKITDNRDKSEPQSREYEIVFDDHPLIFDFFYRFYDDATSALLGKAVFIPNIHAIYDKDVSILAYIHRLDIDEERDKAFRKLKVDNLTDFLKKQIERDGAMKQYLDTVSAKFVSSNTLNYKDMTSEEQIKMKLAEHGIALDFHSKIEGGSVTQYRYEPSIGLKMSRIEKFAADIEQVVKTAGVRILAPIPNTDLVGFEIPCKERHFPVVTPNNRGFTIPIGVDVMGNTFRIDLREAPHLLIAGATGSGKSVCMTSIIRAVAKLPHSDIHLIDPKMVELAPLRDVAASYHEEIDDIRDALDKHVIDMDKRYRQLQKAGVRNIVELPVGRMRYSFIFIDEFADLVIQDKHKRKGAIKETSEETVKTETGKKVIKRRAGVEKSIEDMIIRLAQKGRAAGIHLIMATQRPSVNVISGTIKANFPTRIALRTATSTDSNVILDQVGSEKLLGKGDMLLMTPSEIGIKRLQGYSV